MDRVIGLSSDKVQILSQCMSSATPLLNILYRFFRGAIGDPRHPLAQLSLNLRFRVGA